MVLVPTVITLMVTILRLVGELQGWDPTLFSTEAGGGRALVGIVWLVPLFGFWFGWRLQRSGGGPRPGRVAVTYLVAIAVLAGGGFLLHQAEMVVFPGEDTGSEFRGMPYLLALMAVGTVIAFMAWGRLTLTLLVYGFLARIPVVVVTYFDVMQGWGTHYGALPPAVTSVEGMELFVALSTPQLTVWPLAFTPIVGGLMGCLGAKLAGRR